VTASGKHLRGTASRSAVVSVRVPVDEYLRIKRAARKRHLSVSDYVRSRLPEATVNFRMRRD
jgi:hypothetical protein